MYISYIIYIILNSHCYTGVRAPKLSHRSSYIKEPFGKGLDGLPGGWTGASEGLEGGLRGLRPVQGGFKGAWEGLQGGLKVACLKGASRGLEKVQGGFKGAWEGLEGGFKVKGASRGLEEGLRRASRGLQGGLRRASRGLEKGFKGASSPSHLRAPPGEGPFKPPLKGTFEGGGSDPAPFLAVAEFVGFCAGGRLPFKWLYWILCPFLVGLPCPSRLLPKCSAQKEHESWSFSQSRY